MSQSLLGQFGAALQTPMHFEWHGEPVVLRNVAGTETTVQGIVRVTQAAEQSEYGIASIVRAQITVEEQHVAWCRTTNEATARGQRFAIEAVSPAEHGAIVLHCQAYRPEVTNVSALESRR